MHTVRRRHTLWAETIEPYFIKGCQKHLHYGCRQHLLLPESECPLEPFDFFFPFIVHMYWHFRAMFFALQILCTLNGFDQELRVRTVEILALCTEHVMHPHNPKHSQTSAGSMKGVKEWGTSVDWELTRPKSGARGLWVGDGKQPVYVVSLLVFHCCAGERNVFHSSSDSSFPQADTISQQPR